MRSTHNLCYGELSKMIFYHYVCTFSVWLNKVVIFEMEVYKQWCMLNIIRLLVVSAIFI